MVTISQKYFNDIAQYLRAPLGKITVKDGLYVNTNKDQSTIGVINIILCFLKETNSNLGARTVLEEAQIRQWIEFTIVYVGNANNNQNIHLILKEINNMLSTKTYLVGNRFTIADVSLYYGLLNIMASLSNLDKEKYMNVSRWYDNIQQDSALRQKNRFIDFSTNYLASLVPAKH